MNIGEKNVHLEPGWESAFVKLSSTLTDFNPYSLQGSGQTSDYLKTLIYIVGKPTMESLFSSFEKIVLSLNLSTQKNKEKELFNKINREIMGDAYLGPVARNLVKLWYTGTWYQLPDSWREQYGNHEDDLTFVVSPASYTEGLLWKAIDSNPSGAKGPGYGSWEKPPNIDQDNHWHIRYLCE